MCCRSSAGAHRWFHAPVAHLIFSQELGCELSCFDRTNCCVSISGHSCRICHGLEQTPFFSALSLIRRLRSPPEQRQDMALWQHLTANMLLPQACATTSSMPPAPPRDLTALTSGQGGAAPPDEAHVGRPARARGMDCLHIGHVMGHVPLASHTSTSSTTASLAFPALYTAAHSG